METEAWPDETMHVTFLTEGPGTPLPPPETRQTTFRFPRGTRVVFFDAARGFLVTHPDHPSLRINVNGSVETVQVPPLTPEAGISWRFGHITKS